MSDPMPRDLATLRDHARRMVAERDDPLGNRELWRQIADEIDDFYAADDEEGLW